MWCHIDDPSWIPAQEEVDLAGAGGNLLGTEELGFHDTPDPTEDLPDDDADQLRQMEEEEGPGQTGDMHGEEPDVSHGAEREAGNDLMRAGLRATDRQHPPALLERQKEKAAERTQQAERVEKGQVRLRRQLLAEGHQRGSDASGLRDTEAAGQPSARGRWPRWPWEASRGGVLGDVRSGSQDPKGFPATKGRQRVLRSSACDLAGLIIERLARLFKI